MDPNLRDRKIESIKQMLNFNNPVPKTSNGEIQWKILIYDKLGQDIIAPLLNVKELRDLGVTLHLQLHSDRDPIPDVPAIYFVYPSAECVQRICKDLECGLYEKYYLNFISPISRQRLEEIAQTTISADVNSQIAKVFDQYTNFISLEGDLFIMRNQNSDLISYRAINRPDVQDAEMNEMMEHIVDSLFSVCVTQGAVPIIRCPRGNAAEIVAEKLDKKLRDNLRDSRNCLFNSDSGGAGGLVLTLHRPLLVILDRDMDLATPFHHTWTYQALVHDLLGLKLNKVQVPQQQPQGVKKNEFNLNSHSDKFWHAHKGDPFPQVAEAVQQELEDVRAKQDQVSRLKAAMSPRDNEIDVDPSSGDPFGDHTSALSSAVSSVPEMIEQKRLLDMHTTIATALADHIKTRRLDLFFELEEKLLARQPLQEKSLLELMNDSEAGTPVDKLRLLLIALMCEPQLVESDLEKYTKLVEAAHTSASSPQLQQLIHDANVQEFMPAVKYIRRCRMHRKMEQSSAVPAASGSLFTKWMSHGSAFLMEGVKNLVVKKHNLLFTRIVDALMETKSLPEVEEFRYFDPKQLRPTDGAPGAGGHKQSFQEAVVFVIGGGNYIEYQNLVDYRKSKTAVAPRRITYGCSEMLNAQSFLAQLSELGKLQ